jgi:hypothetical protein
MLALLAMFVRNIARICKRISNLPGFLNIHCHPPGVNIPGWCGQSLYPL